MGTGEPLIRFKHAAIGYGRKVVLSGVDLAVERDAFVGVLGPNGSGKTTLMRTLLGLIPCLKGQLVLSGAGGRPPRLGYVPQKERLDPIFPLSAYDVASMGAYRRFDLMRRLRREDDRPLVERALAACGASALAARAYGDLSGGQKQRVLIARALASEPQLLVLDEPLAGIDVSTQKALIELLRKLKVERGLTVLMVSHRIHVERGLFTHVLLCDEGEATIGPTEEMLSGGRLRALFENEP
ncbi:MAG: metal ABC transporter ATP-binding protein [Elusimicrobia bacterium]|nr:metal ABC transporter ATP-binding protein [Elusimicrobiota bacterium]